MIGIFLLLLNNHRKFTDTVHNIQFTTNNLNNAKNNGNKYFSDMYGHNYDISTGHMVKKGIDKYTGHRGIIDIQTGKTVEDHIEQTILYEWEK